MPPCLDPFLGEVVLVNVSEKVQFHVCHCNSSFPEQIRGSVIMGRIQTIMLVAHVCKFVLRMSSSVTEL